MIHGAHVIIYSKDADADRAFFKDTLKYEYADAGHGWLIFALPPAEVAVHPGEKNDTHELYLMCDDVEAFVADMKSKKVKTGSISDEGWGRLTSITLPGGGKLGVYEPRHASPVAKAGRASAKKGGGKAQPPAKSASKKAAPAKLAKRSGTPAKQAFVSAKNPKKKKGVTKK